MLIIRIDFILHLHNKTKRLRSSEMDAARDAVQRRKTMYLVLVSMKCVNP